MREKTRLRIAGMIAIILIGIITGCIFMMNTNWFQRNYAYYGDHIEIYAYEDGRLLDAQEYEISLLEEWYYEKNGQPFTKNHWSYSVGGDYGTYWFTLKWQGRETAFYLENTNDWWRTNINLYIDTGRDVVQQTNVVWNNNPAFAETFTLEWEDGGHQ